MSGGFYGRPKKPGSGAGDQETNNRYAIFVRSDCLAYSKKLQQKLDCTQRCTLRISQSRPQKGPQLLTFPLDEIDILRLVSSR